MNPYYQGQLVHITNGVGFQDINGSLEDPPTVKLVVGRRGQTAVVNATYPASPVGKTSVGLYFADCDSTMWVPDAYWYKWLAAGETLSEGTFLLLPVDV